jgi:hypothetical protein
VTQLDAGVLERYACAPLQLATPKQLATPRSDYNPVRSLAEQISRAEPRYSAKSHHISDITARPRLLPVTESIVLPPRPKAVNMSNIDKFICEWLVPPILLPIFLVLLAATATFIQW